MRRSSITKLLTCSAIAMSAVALTPAQAQENISSAEESASQPVDEILVTARKRNERMIDVPETISAFSEAALEKAGITNLDKLGQAVPNISLNRRGDNEPNVVIRGIGSFGNVQGIGFYVDDVQNFTDQASRLVDLERVEILKGPQGSLYGGSSIGGAVKFVTKKPSGIFEGAVGVELGEQSIFNVNASVNIPLSDVLFARFSGYADTNDGFLRNAVTRINNDKSEEYGFRGAFRFSPSDETEVNLSLRYSHLNNGGNDYYLTTDSEDYRSRSDLDQNIYNRRQIFGTILDVNRRIGDLSLTSLTSYTERKNRILWDLDYTPADGVWVFQRNPLKARVFTQELRLQSDNSEGLNWLVGAYYSRVQNRSLVTKADVVIGVDFGGAPDFIFDFHDNKSVEQTYAAFATVSYESGPFEASLGARLNHSDFFGLNRLIDDSAHVKDTIVLPKLTLSYKVDPAIMLYFNVAQGYEPGRFSLFNTVPLLPYKPEKAWNFELGAKGQTDGGLLSYEIAGFYIKSTDRQLETLVLDPNGIPQEAIGNVGDARSYGAEASLTLRPLEGLSINANGGWVNSKFTAGQFDGLRVPYAPRFSTGASVDYTVPLSSLLQMSLRADLTHNAGFQWNPLNTISQEAYNLVAARIAISDTDEKWEFALRADNIFNEKYHSELQPFGSDLLARRGQPRLIVGTAKLRF